MRNSIHKLITLMTSDIDVFYNCLPCNKVYHFYAHRIALNKVPRLEKSLSNRTATFPLLAKRPHFCPFCFASCHNLCRDASYSMFSMSSGSVPGNLSGMGHLSRKIAPSHVICGQKFNSAL